MTPAQFEQLLNNENKEWKWYVQKGFGLAAGDISIRFINGNFNAQGWQGKNFENWKPLKKPRPGKILVKTGTLKRSTHAQAGAAQVRVYNDAPYARVHNEGFNGWQDVNGYQRKKLSAKSVNTGRLNIKGKQAVRTVHEVSNVVNVRPFRRQMNIPQRQFMPRFIDDSPVLVNAIKRDIMREAKRIFPNSKITF